MNLKFLLLILIVLCGNVSFSQIKFDPIKLQNSKVYGAEIASLLDTIEVYEFKDTNANTLFLKNGFRSANYLNGKEWLEIAEENEVYRIDIVYSKYPLRNGEYAEIYPLLLNRLYYLFTIDSRLNSSLIEWNKVWQTHCENNSQVDQLLHGVLIWYRPIVESPDEIDSVLILNTSNSSSTLSFNDINESKEVKEQLQILINSDLLSDSLRNVIQHKSIIEQQQTIIHLLEKRLSDLPEEDLSKIDRIKRKKYEQELSKFTKYSQNDIVTKVFNRHPEWKDILVINDWTGSMYGYGGQVLQWHLNNLETSGITNITLFNDGDNKATSEKVIGETGGIYTENADNIERLIALFNLVMMKGYGGDGPENDIEAILKAIELSPEAKEIVLIADNNACIRDILLSDRIKKPVRIIVCGATDNAINPDLAYLAQITGGGIYLIEEDIEKLALKIEGETLILGEEKRFSLLKSMCSNWLIKPMVKYKSFKETRFKSKKKIHYLDVSNQLNGEIPKKLFKLKGLLYLDLSNNKLGELTIKIGQLVQLKNLNLSSNNLKSLPSEFNRLNFLTYLNLSNNELIEIPVKIMELYYLDTLILANNQLKNLPKVVNLNKLNVLDISGNKLKKLPSRASSLKKLHYLNAANNEFVNFSPSICRLIELEYLDLSGNKLTDIPLEIKNLKKLKELHLEGNNLSNELRDQLLVWLPNTHIYFE